MCVRPHHRGRNRGERHERYRREATQAVGVVPDKMVQDRFRPLPTVFLCISAIVVMLGLVVGRMTDDNGRLTRQTTSPVVGTTFGSLVCGLAFGAIMGGLAGNSSAAPAGRSS